MNYDPAWDMPQVNWQQQGSFVIPEIPPAYEPDDAPLVCLPAINRYWLPYVMGALDQLRNPSSWIVADDDAMYNTLARVSKLREMIGVGAPCMSYEIRFDGGLCQLQQSTDGGTTWTEVEGWADFTSCLPPQLQIQLSSGCELQYSEDGGTTFLPVTGWDENFGPCVQEAAPIVGLPPNPGGEDKPQLACSIADYLANEIILNAMSAAVTAIQDNLTLLSFGANILNLIPEFVITRAGVDAIAAVYGAVSEGTLSDYEDAIADGTLWVEVACAIYNAILSDGYVTPGNFAAIVSAVGGISYSHSDVITALIGYINALGAVGLAQLSQGAGLNELATCDTCGTWCYKFDLTTSDTGVTAYNSGRPPLFTPGVGVVSQHYGSPAPSGEYCDFYLTLPAAAYVTTAYVQFITAATDGGAPRTFYAYSGVTEEASTGLDPNVTTGELQPLTVNATIDNLLVILRSYGTSLLNSVQFIQLEGTGANPFGSDNC